MADSGPVFWKVTNGKAVLITPEVKGKTTSDNTGERWDTHIPYLLKHTPLLTASSTIASFMSKAR